MIPAYKNKYALGYFAPALEDKDYNGLYIRSDEMDDIARQLIGKPVLLEHDVDDVVGEVVDAWKDEDGAGKVFFKFNASAKGRAAHQMMIAGKMLELSLGHSAEIDADTYDVSNKQATEVSICQEGARPGTHILACTASKKKKSGHKKKYRRIALKTYILNSKSSQVQQPAKTKTMPGPLFTRNAKTGRFEKYNPDAEKEEKDDSEEEKKVEVEAEASKTTEEEVAPAKEAPSMNINDLQDLLSQLQKYKSENDNLKKQNEEITQAGKRKREMAAPTLNQFFQGLVKENEKELSHHATAYENMVKNMVNDPASMPIMEALECAAGRHSGNITKLEELVQENKRLKTELDGFRGQRFSQKTERVQQKAPAQKISVGASKEQLMQVGGMGAKNLNPSMWAQLCSAPAGEGQGTFKNPAFMNRDWNNGGAPTEYTKIV